MSAQPHLCPITPSPGCPTVAELTVMPGTGTMMKKGHEWLREAFLRAWNIKKKKKKRIGIASCGEELKIKQYQQKSSQPRKKFSRGRFSSWQINNAIWHTEYSPKGRFSLLQKTLHLLLSWHSLTVSLLEPFLLVSLSQLPVLEVQISSPTPNRWNCFSAASYMSIIIVTTKH